MKKILIFLFFPLIVSAQEYATTDNGKRVLLNKNGTYKYLKDTPNNNDRIFLKNFKETDGLVIYPEALIKMENADEKKIDVKFSFISTKEEFSTLTESSINIMVTKANIEVMHLMKNKYTYTPKKILMIHSAENQNWIIDIAYTAQNDYGGLKDGHKLVTMTGDGFVYRVE